jgi:hypothetical protein
VTHLLILPGINFQVTVLALLTLFPAVFTTVFNVYAILLLVGLFAHFAATSSRNFKALLDHPIG